MTLPDVSSAEVDQELDQLVRQLTLEDKIALIQGADFWATTALPAIGLRSMVLSDGPAGVRGSKWDERDPSLNLPSGSALAASWDPTVAYEYAAAAAYEARRKGVDVVLGPTINLHRSPLGGRHFECFSEDPELTAQLAEAYVRGLQDNGVAATPKHYVANDSETERRTVDVQVSRRALRELYLAPFERAVSAGAWAVMSSYNAIDGVTMSENDLLENPLNSEWGFDGAVISDWSGVTSLGSIAASQDLAMPGPAPAYAGLLEAVESGDVSEQDIDRKIRRILRLARRVGALEPSTAVSAGNVDGIALARRAAVEGSVLLKNDALLPLNHGSVSSVAVIGHNAVKVRTQGGGSATVVPAHIISPLDAIRASFPEADITYSLGALVQSGVSEIPLARLKNPVTGECGVRATFLDEHGSVLLSEDRYSTRLVWFNADAPLKEAATLVVETAFTAEESATVMLGYSGMIAGKLYVDDNLVVSGRPVASATQLGASFLNPPSRIAPIDLRTGETVTLRAEFTIDAFAISRSSLSLTVGIEPDASAPDDLISAAVKAAQDAEVAVVVVGTNSVVESEGHDRENLDLPGRQDDLVRAVAAVNARTVVVVNAGAPVSMPWRADVGAILLSFFGGQEVGPAIASILTGADEPGGRLPTTWPAELADAPVTDVVPVAGRLDYTEGIHIGYRAWLKASAEPAYPFGHGLGYTDWLWNDARRVGDALEVTLTNYGGRSGKQVVQVYAERASSTVERPVRWLVGFGVVRAEAGEDVRVEVALPSSRFRHWSEQGWEIESGEFELSIGCSVSDTRLRASWSVE